MLHTLDITIDAGHLTTFTSITSQPVRKYLPLYKAAVKGRLKAIRKGLRYGHIPSPSINNTTATSASTPTIIE